VKFLKIVAVSYLVKTLLVGVAWLFIPDLPTRAVDLARRTWAWFDAAPAAAAPVPPSPPPASAAARTE
jgi:hypothetical protein